MSGIKIEGLDELEKHLKKGASMNLVRQTVQRNGAELKEKIASNANFDKGYQTGTTKRSVKLEITDGGFTAESGPTTEYAEYVERGTRFMDEQPFVQPAFEEQLPKFKSDMKKLVR